MLDELNSALENWGTHPLCFVHAVPSRVRWLFVSNRTVLDCKSDPARLADHIKRHIPADAHLVRIDGRLISVANADEALVVWEAPASPKES